MCCKKDCAQAFNDCHRYDSVWVDGHDAWVSTLDNITHQFPNTLEQFYLSSCFSETWAAHTVPAHDAVYMAIEATIRAFDELDWMPHDPE